MIKGLSLCMIVKNEAELIEKALLSANQLVNEMIVVDTGSTDGTQDIARKLGAKVFFKEWNNDFADMRNYSIQLASQPFILILDADETILEGEQRILQGLFGHLEVNEGSAGTVTIISETTTGETSTSAITRIFPNDDRYRYVSRIHEQLTFHGKPVSKTFDSGIRLFHSGYTYSQITKKNKYERNLQLLMNELKDDADKSYILFQVGKTYYNMMEYALAKRYLQECIDLEMSNNKRNFLSGALLIMGYCCISLRNFDELLKYYKLAIEFYPDYTDLYFMYGVGLIEARSLNAFNEIPNIFKKCVELGEPSSLKYETVRGVGSFKAYFNLGLYYELTNNREQAVYYYDLSSKSGYEPALKRLHHIL